MGKVTLRIEQSIERFLGEFGLVLRRVFAGEVQAINRHTREIDSDLDFAGGVLLHVITSEQWQGIIALGVIHAKAALRCGPSHRIGVGCRHTKIVIKK